MDSLIMKRFNTYKATCKVAICHNCDDRQFVCATCSHGTRYCECPASDNPNVKPCRNCVRPLTEAELADAMSERDNVVEYLVTLPTWCHGLDDDAQAALIAGAWRGAWIGGHHAY